MLLDNLLMKADKISMAHSLEVRVPFLTRSLVEFGLGLPPRSKIGSWRDKTPDARTCCARSWARGWPTGRSAASRSRSTAGFASRPRRCLRAGLRTGALVRELGFNGDAIDALIARHLGGEDIGRKLFALPSLERWASASPEPAQRARAARSAPGRVPRCRGIEGCARSRARAPNADRFGGRSEQPHHLRGEVLRIAGARDETVAAASTSSGGAPSSLTTTGHPAAIASATTRPNPSWRELSTKTSSARITAAMSRRAPAKVESGARGPARGRALDVSLVFVLHLDLRRRRRSRSAPPASAATIARRRTHECLQILARVNPADRPDQRLSRTGAQRGAHLF